MSGLFGGINPTIYGFKYVVVPNTKSYKYISPPEFNNMLHSPKQGNPEVGVGVGVLVFVGVTVGVNPLVGVTVGVFVGVVVGSGTVNSNVTQSGL
jgi:hypothetical protein